MYSTPWGMSREEIEYEFLSENRLLTASGVTEDEATFIPNIYNGGYEIGVELPRTRSEIWFQTWEEAHRYVVSKFPNKRWEESGWNH